MKILDRYLARTVIAGTLLALFILLAIDLFFIFVQEVHDIGKGHYALKDALIFVTLTAPGRIHEILPMAALLGSLLSLGTLASGSELIAMRAAGVSVLRIAQSVLKAGLIILVAAAVIGEWVAPWAEQQAQQRRSLAQTGTVTLRSEHGLWARDGNNFINIRQVLPDGKLSDVQVYELDKEGGLRTAMRARSAEHMDKGWRLQDVQRGEIEGRSLSVKQADALDWPTLLSPRLLNVVTINPLDLSARDLYRYGEYMHENGLDASRYDLAFWRRVLAPVAGLVMLFLSIPFVFGPLRDAGTGQRLLWGVLVGVAFFLLNRTMSQVGQIYGLSAFFSALLPSLIFFGGGLWVLRKVR